MIAVKVRCHLKVAIMSTKKECKLLTQILDLKGIQVRSHREHEGIGIILQVESGVNSSACIRCGQKSSRLHQNHRHIVKDISWGEKKVFLEINRRQFKCEKCQRPFSEELDLIGSRRNYTKRLAVRTIEEVLADDIYSIAKKGVVTTAEIERMLEDASKEFSKVKPVGLKKLGIDEIALKKGQGNYCAVLIDIETSKLLTILEGRTKEEIKKVMIDWGTEVLDNIEEVSIDLWTGYKSLVLEVIPNAQIVADRFHVMIQINKELDDCRKKERRVATKKIKEAESEEEKSASEEILAGITSSKYVLLKNEENLGKKQKKKLRELKSVSPNLKMMHELKEQFKKILDKEQDWFKGLLELGKWLSKAKEYFPNSYGTIVRWLDEIIAYFDNRTTSGVVEGINNKLKLIKRSGYGFKNFSNFKNRCLLSWHFNC
jgi:transposase